MTAPQPPQTYGDQHKTADDIRAMPQQQRDAYLDQYMSPSERSAYLHDQASQVGQNDHSFLGLRGVVERLKAEAAANKTSQALAQQNVQQASTGDVQYVTGLQPSSANYKGINHDDLKGYVNTNLDASQVGELSDAYHQMSSIFNQFASTLGTAVSKSHGEWEGAAADSARSYFTSLQKWADANSQNSTLASEVVYQQSTAASTAKNSMPEPIPFSWSDEVNSWTSSNPFNIVDNMQKSVEKAQQSQDAHDQAAQVMTTYDQGLYSAASKQPVFAEPPKFDGSSSSTSSQMAENIGSVGSGVGGTVGSGVGGAGGHSGGTGGSSGSVSGTLAGLTGSPSSLAAGAKTGGVSPGAYGGTSAQSYQSPNGGYNSSTSGPGSNNLNTLGGMPMGPMGGFGGAGGGDEYSSKLGRGGSASGFGPGGSGSAAGSGSATGAGAQTGGRAGGAGAAESAAATGRGAGGSSGRPGMSGMGGHGGKGQGGEDEEHQRPSWLIEPDPDDVFGTSERTAPPVIGE